jgi:DnaD/phage-associated family protein
MEALIAYLDTLDLPAPVWRTAVRLAQRAGEHLTINLSYEELRAIVGTDSDNTARAHLTTLHRAGVLWFRRNGLINISFCRDVITSHPSHHRDRSAITVMNQRSPVKRNGSLVHQNDESAITVMNQRSPVERNGSLVHQNDESAITVMNQRSPVEDHDYITTTTTNVVVDDDDHDHHRLSSSSQPKPSKLQPPSQTKPPTPQPQPPAGYAELQALYESNIGLITPIMRETLQAALQVYPFEWIERAIELAVRNGVHRWSYVEGILTNWKAEGFNGNKGKSSNMAATGGNAGRRDQANRRTASAGAIQQQQYGPEWDFFDIDKPPDIDDIA